MGYQHREVYKGRSQTKKRIKLLDGKSTGHELLDRPVRIWIASKSVL